MGAVLSWLIPQEPSSWRSHDPTEILIDIMHEELMSKIDPNTGLSLRQRNAIEDTWRIVQRKKQRHAVDFFIEFFKTFPEYQKEFKSFADVPIDDLFSNKKLKAHALSVMNAISMFVDNLDDIEVLKEFLIKTGKSHGVRKITPVHFDNVAMVFVRFLGMILGSTFTPFVQAAWETIFQTIISIIKLNL